MELDKGGYVLTYDCDNHTALRYEYTLTEDNGAEARPSSFYLDPELPEGCERQASTASYQSEHGGYDRGHLATSNHLDYSASDIHEASYMSNIVPQVSGFNQGIWVKAENVAECYCDIAPITVCGGVVYDDTSNDYFQTSHGIRTPDFFWRTVVTTDPETGDEKTISWLIPNEADLGNLDDSIVSIDALEADFGARYVGITASAATKALRPETTWRQPSGCDLGLVADIQRP